MSKRNYSQYSKKKDKPTNPMTDTPVEEAKTIVDDKTKKALYNLEPVVEMVNETVETVTLPELLEGTVVGCAKLNVRAEPNITADIVCVLDNMTELAVDVANSNNEWVRVCTATGIEGYCVRKFIDVLL